MTARKSNCVTTKFLNAFVSECTKWSHSDEKNMRSPHAAPARREYCRSFFDKRVESDGVCDRGICAKKIIGKF